MSEAECVRWQRPVPGAVIFLWRDFLLTIKDIMVRSRWLAVARLDEHVIDEIAGQPYSEFMSQEV